MANFFQQKKARLRACSATPHRWLGAFFIAALLDVLDAGEYLLHAGASLARNWESKSAVAGAVAGVADRAAEILAADRASLERIGEIISTVEKRRTQAAGEHGKEKAVVADYSGSRGNCGGG